MSVLVTGANGFIGRAVVRRLASVGADVMGAVRRPSGESWEVVGPALGIDSDWRHVLKGVRVVVHAAARAHVLKGSVARSIDAFRIVNSAGTECLAQQAAEMGVTRFVFISSIGVNGSRSVRPFTESDSPAPVEPYAVSKLEAERALWRVSEQSGMEIVILRPPLVYGPGAPGNFARLLEAVRRGVPLPLGGITENRRTFIALHNLVDLITLCVDHPRAANQVFLAGDGEDLSTADLIRRVARSLGVRPRLVTVPSAILVAAAAMIGRREAIDRLCNSLQLDGGKVCQLLSWHPPIGVDEGLRRVARGLE